MPRKKTTKVPIKPREDDEALQGAPFDHEEENPEPMDMDTLDHQDFGSDWESVVDDCSECSDFHYDATSMTLDDDCCPGSVHSSPGLFEPRSVLVEAQTPPGVSVTFDDESWIV